MLETLAGRLRWENTGSGIYVEIPARLDWTLAFFIIWLAGWSFGGWDVGLQTFSKPNPPIFDLLWLAAWAVGECVVITSVVWSLGGRSFLALDPSSFQFTHRMCGNQLSRKTFATANVRNLRHVPASHRGRQSTGGKISFEADGKTHSFASRLKDAEAFALIDKMLDVYKFPKDRALEYMSTS